MGKGNVLALNGYSMTRNSINCSLETKQTFEELKEAIKSLNAFSSESTSSVEQGNVTVSRLTLLHDTANILSVYSQSDGAFIFAFLLVV
jgi:hypothetical protein